MRGFTEALRREYADTPLQVLYVAPRATDTAMNSAQVRQMNAELGTATDSPQQVARQIVDALQHERRVRYLGWPERLFVRLNALFPALVDRALRKQLPIIRRYARLRLRSASAPSRSLSVAEGRAAEGRTLESMDSGLKTAGMTNQ